MKFQVALLLAGLAMGIAGVYDRIFSDEEDVRKRRKTRRIGVATLAILAVTLFLQGFNYYETDQNARALEEHFENVFSDVPEASGGVTIGEYAYLVSDDEPGLFKTRFKEEKHLDEGKYSNETKLVELYDKELTDSDDADAHLLTKTDVDDLEAAAYFNGKLYLITSHSDNKSEKFKPQRQRFLEVELKTVKTKDDAELEIGVVTRWANLRPAIDKVLFQEPKQAEEFKDRMELKATKPTRTVMEIEGLAIDDEENVYLGFRAPQKLDSSNALLLRTNLKQIFADGETWTTKKGEPAEKSRTKFEVFDVYLGGYLKEPYGIVDMIYHDGSLLILTNGVFKNDALSPGLWKWRVNDIKPGGEASRIGENFFSPPLNIHAKPEVLLLPTNRGAAGKVFMFLDATGFGGGQRWYLKTQFGLAP